MEQQRAAGRLQSSRIVPTDAVEQSLVRRYVEAWQACDVGGLAGLLTHDVVLTMPPLPLRYTGRAAVVAFYAGVPFAGVDRLSFRPTRANRQPAVAAYRLDPDTEMYRALGIWVLRADGDSIAEITAFVDPTLPAVFGLPTESQDDPGRDLPEGGVVNARCIARTTDSATPEQVFSAITERAGLSSWWTPDVVAEPTLGSVAEFRFRGGQFVVKMEITALEPGRTVRWAVRQGAPEWANTSVTWDLSPVGHHTRCASATAGTLPSTAPSPASDSTGVVLEQFESLPRDGSGQAGSTARLNDEAKPTQIMPAPGRPNT